MKVFVPFYEDAVAETALHGADLVPFERGYNLLHVERARPGDPLPEVGHAQILPPDDWPRPTRMQAGRH